MTENSSVIPSSPRFKSATILRKNEPAPKVPRRDSLAASDSDTNGPICQSGTTSSGGESFSTEQTAKKCTGLWKFERFADQPNIVQMHRFDPTCPQHRLHLGSTLTNKALGSYFDPLGSNMLELGPSWEQLRSELKFTWLQNG